MVRLEVSTRPRSAARHRVRAVPRMAASQRSALAVGHRRVSVRPRGSGTRAVGAGAHRSLGECRDDAGRDTALVRRMSRAVFSSRGVARRMVHGDDVPGRVLRPHDQRGRPAALLDCRSGVRRRPRVGAARRSVRDAVFRSGVRVRSGHEGIGVRCADRLPGVAARRTSSAGFRRSNRTAAAGHPDWYGVGGRHLLGHVRRGAESARRVASAKVSDAHHQRVGPGALRSAVPSGRLGGISQPRHRGRTSARDACRHERVPRVAGIGPRSWVSCAGDGELQQCISPCRRSCTTPSPCGPFRRSARVSSCPSASSRRSSSGWSWTVGRPVRDPGAHEP